MADPRQPNLVAGPLSPHNNNTRLYNVICSVIDQLCLYISVQIVYLIDLLFNKVTVVYSTLSFIAIAKVYRLKGELRCTGWKEY